MMMRPFLLFFGNKYSKQTNELLLRNKQNKPNQSFNQTKLSKQATQASMGVIVIKIKIDKYDRYTNTIKNFAIILTTNYKVAWSQSF